MVLSLTMEGTMGGLSKALRVISVLAVASGGLTAEVVVAQTDGCVNYSSSDIRTFQIKQIIKPGMKEAEVKRIWGEPTKVRHNYPGGDEWEYWNPSGDQIVTFAQHGCVTGRYTARD